jgi:cobalt/nickel transport system permease protein
MSHIHIPDGVLPIPLWLGAFIITGIILFYCLKVIVREDVKKKVPFIGILSALMLLTMSVPLGFLPFHLNLTVLMGILAGPRLAFVSIFVVNLFLSMLGHGGFTIIGLNTLIIGFEAFLGYKLYYLLKGMGFKKSAALATVFTLLITTALMVTVVVGAGAGWDYAMPHQHDHHDQEHPVDLHHPDHPDHTGHLHEVLDNLHFLFITGWGALLLILALGIGIEAFVITLILSFILKVKPELIKAEGV